MTSGFVQDKIPNPGHLIFPIYTIFSELLQVMTNTILYRYKKGNLAHVIINNLRF